MKGLWLGVLLLAACGNDDHGRSVIANAPVETSAPAPDPVAKPAPPPPPAASAPAGSAARPAAPDPTTPAEIEHARNQAMIDGRDKDVLHFCELGKLDAKSNPQALLGCTLAACRIKDADTAKRYSQPLAKAYLDQARRVCAANQISL